MEDDFAFNILTHNNCLDEHFLLHELDEAIDRARCTSPGADGISAGVIKEFLILMCQILLVIFNMIWSRGECPQAWKRAILIPIPKPGKDCTDPLSYRPIALTSVLCKIMERMVIKRMIWFLESKNLLNPIQSGFRKGRRTIDHLVRLESSVNRGFADKASTVAVFLDIKKAYDMVWRMGIIIKMQKLGLEGNVLKWVSNLLSTELFKLS